MKDLSRDNSKKHGEVNLSLFQKNWSTPENPKRKPVTFTYDSDFGGGQSPFSPVPGMETPLFYDLSVLANDSSTQSDRIKPRVTHWLLFFQTIYFKFGRKLARILRAVRKSIN